VAKETVNITFSSSGGYLKAVDYLLDHIQDEEVFRNPNKYAFILVAASALESIINNAIIFWAHHHFNPKDYKRMASAFISMSLRGKLDSYIHLVSDGQYVTNNESEAYQVLSELIKVRNEVAHAKDFFHECELETEEHEDGHLSFEVPNRLKDILSDTPLSLAQDQCVKCQAALHHLREMVTEYNDPVGFDTSDFCKKVAQQGVPEGRSAGKPAPRP
jgi:hypothetical protein